MEKKLVSIIVPVYNVEKYLNQCLKSLVNQTLKNIEIIVVNDGSTDNSEKIIKQYKQQYKNIKYIKQPNQGLSMARNTGIENATAQYIGFVDSDDYIDESMYEKLYTKIISQNFDMVACNVEYFYDNGEQKKFIVSSEIHKDIINKENIKKSMLNIYPSAWNKIYKKSLFDEEKFKKNIWFEDVECLYRLFPNINSIGMVNEALYYYRQRKGTITSSIDLRIYNYIENWNGILKFYKDKGIYNEYKKILEYCYIRYVYGTFIKAATKYNKNEFNKAVKIAMDEVNKNFLQYKKNRYFYTNIKGLYLLLFNKKIASVIYKKYHHGKTNN